MADGVENSKPTRWLASCGCDRFMTLIELIVLMEYLLFASGLGALVAAFAFSMPGLLLVGLVLMAPLVLSVLVLFLFVVFFQDGGAPPLHSGGDDEITAANHRAPSDRKRC